MNTMRKTYLPLSDEDRDYLKALSKKRTIQAQVVDRARILLKSRWNDIPANC